MGIVYSHSEEEEKELKKQIHEKKYSPFHTNFLDEKGNPTDGSIRQIIFGSEELRKKSINDKFVRPSSNFHQSIEQIKKLVELYPFFFDLYEESKVKELRKLLKINDANQQRIILKQLLKEFNLSNPIPDGDLAQLEMIYGLKQSKELSKLAKITGKNQFSFAPNELDNLMMQGVSDHLFLRREPEFLNETILVYMVTIFKEYLKSVLKVVFTLYPEIMEGTETKISLDGMPDRTDKITTIFTKHLKFDLQKQVIEWNLIEEIFLRRNLLIHNNGFPDKDYKDKTRILSNSRFKTDTKYVKESLKTFEKCQKAINNFLWKQYGNPKFLEQMSSEDVLE